MSISLEQQQFKELRTSLLMIPARQSRQSLGLAGGQEALSAVCEQSQARHIRVPGIFEQIWELESNHSYQLLAREL